MSRGNAVRGGRVDQGMALMDGQRAGLKRREVLAGVAGAALGLSAGSWPLQARAQQGGAADKPNVLALLTDDQTHNTIRMLGNGAIRTPNLDRLAARGTSFSRCFTQGSWVWEVCGGSRTTLHSGRHLFNVVEPFDSRAAGELKTEYPLWAEHFRKQGYDTFATGKWVNGLDSFQRCFTHGDAVMPSMLHTYDRNNRVTGKPIVTGHAFMSQLKHYDGTQWIAYEKEQWSTDAFAEATIEFLKRRKEQAKPFFAYVGFTAPHDPRHAPPQYADLYNPRDIELPPNVSTDPPFFMKDFFVRDEQVLDRMDRETVKREIALYYAMITQLDDRIGDILKALNDAGQADNTFIVFTSDNGLALGQHGLMGKSNLYDHSVRVPMVWSGPGINPAEISEEMVYLHSLYATTCELAGLDVPDHVQASSLVPVMSGNRRGEKSIYGCCDRVMRMLRTDRYKLIHYPKHDRVELFDLAEDPWERNDLSGRAELRGQMKQLDQALSDWQEQAGDTLALPAID